MPSNGPEIIGPGGIGPIKFPKMNIRLPQKFTGIAIALLVTLVIVVIAFNSCFTYIRPFEVGIKQVNIGVFSKRGIQEKVYGPGLAFRMPFGFEQIHRFPQHVQVLDLTLVSEKNQMASYSAARAAKIQTSDGFYVDVDASILYRIADPYNVITTLGPGDQFLTQGVLPKAEAVLKQALGELTTEDFYNSPMRVEKANRARELLDAELSPKGLQVDHVLVRYFRYSDEIQRNIEEKKLQDQMVFKNQSEAKAATEAAHVKQIVEEGLAQVSITLEEGEAYKVRKEAEKDLYVRRNKAEADLLIELAEAKRTELRNDAMQSLGAERAVAMKMAEVLRGLDVIIIPTGGSDGMNPLDLDRTIEMFGGIGDSTAVGGVAANAEVAVKNDFSDLFGGSNDEEPENDE